LKTYLLFLGPLAEDRSFTDSGVQGCKRWVERIVKLESKVGSVQDDESVIKKLHQTIKSVGEDLEDLKYNTAIAKLMELTNTLSSCEKISKPIWEKFLVLIAPFAPAAAEEMWVNLGHKDSIFVGNNWPSYDAKLIVEDKIELVIQINGKVRDKIMVSADITEQEAIRLVKRSEKLKKFLGESDFKKVIFVPGKLINIVV
ncbi:MAG: class I tRNA ligase family protein, partial [Patescibacteria group bacterium]|nr:class I tRNA ligase family protein [Patescibacteria group bacterium]